MWKGQSMWHVLSAFDPSEVEAKWWEATLWHNRVVTGPSSSRNGLLSLATKQQHKWKTRVTIDWTKEASVLSRQKVMTSGTRRLLFLKQSMLMCLKSSVLVINCGWLFLASTLKTLAVVGVLSQLEQLFTLQSYSSSEGLYLWTLFPLSITRKPV